MKTRIITAVLALIVFVPLIIIGDLPLLVLTIALGIVAMSEVLKMTHTLLVSFEALISYIGVVAIILPKDFWQSGFWPATVNSQSVIYGLAFLFLARTVFAKKSFNFQDAGTLFLAMVYIGTGFHYFYLADFRGLPVLFFGMFLVWLTDSFAYFVGRSFGKHKLSPNLSPNKTWEGSVGGTAIAVAVVVTLYALTNALPYAVWNLVIMAILLSIAGQIGDLIESALKRHFGVKDSGRILPGHGGILDRFDSMLVVMPLMAVLGMLQ